WEVDLPEPPAGPPDAVDEALRRGRAGWRYVVLYAGNYGWGHDLSILFDYLRRNRGQRDFFFLFVGGGEKGRGLAALARGGGGGARGWRGWRCSRTARGTGSRVGSTAAISAWSPWKRRALG